ncbi:SIR2 family protein [Mariniflexile sp. HMF6888]|uniref:SIR2 family protein n=1 Tax=Mariniflexile sp. HMF6888 TaxID=3373086 RepID=UPI0037B13A11
MDLKNDTKTVQFLEETIFPNMYNENTILFLGAGFSHTQERNYLGSTLVNYYQEKLGVDLETKDLVEFIDRASRLENFSRQQFDQYVKGLLQKLKPEEAHKKVATMGWRQIVTTNMDLLLENAYSQIHGKTEEYKEILPIRSVNEYQKTISKDQIKYIKLNGCLSDLSKYKFIFSTQDFTDNKIFYNKVLSNFSSLTNDVSFLSIGYSFTDGISKRLLEELNKNNQKNDKKIFNIDPFPNEALIPFLEENNVITIRMTASDFFGYYDDWAKERYARQERKLPKVYFNASNNNPVQINARLNLRLRNNLKQLHKNNKENNIRPDNYYRGEEPNYSIILDNYDVLKKELNRTILDSILSAEIKNNLIPVNFIAGSNGVGKTTAVLRAINQLQTQYDYIAFELVEINGLRAQDLEELFNASSSENIILLADNVERHTYFKELMTFRVSLSEHQFNKNITILAPIRENILEIHLLNYKYQNINRIDANHKLTDEEINDLISKLKTHRLITVRDKQEEGKIRDKIRKAYSSDPYVTMLSLIENSTLLRAISDNLNQINSEAQIAFEFTSLLYQYKIPMPASILKKIINMDWDDFKVNVLRVDCKGLLLNEITSPIDIKEDLVFRTKHRIISGKFIESRYKSEDKLLKAFLKIVRALNPNDEHAKIVVDLFKAIRKNRTFSQKQKLDKLYDEASIIFTTHPLFNIHYAKNLQYRRSITHLKKAAERLMHVDSTNERRNSAITHTRGAIEFQLAKHYHKENDIYIRDEYLYSAEEFFEIKRAIDPFSSYSYYDYLVLEMWKIQNLKLTDEEVLKQHITIQNLFIKAYESVVENTEYIEKLRGKYVNEIKINQFSKAEILKHLEELYINPETRVLALIFKLNSLENKILDFGNKFLTNLTSENIIDELSDYNHLDIVEKALFDYHCNRLYDIDSRMALNSFNSEQFEENNFFKYHYYSYIKESYNLQFSFGTKHLTALKKAFNYLNPSVQEIWLDQESLKPKIFTGIIKNVGNYKIYIASLGRDFYRFKSEIDILKGNEYYCNLVFTVKGIRAEIIGEK